jgi:hypothetical protein
MPDGAGPKATTRPFTLLDAVVLLAATALGIAGARQTWNEMVGLRPAIPDAGWFTVDGLDQGAKLAMFLLPCLVAWTLATSVLILLRPRPPLRKVLRQPGAAACAIAAFCMALKLAGWLITDGLAAYFPAPVPEGERTLHVPLWDRVQQEILEDLVDPIGYAIAGTWFLMLITRRLRCGSGYLDRLACMLGILWIGMGICQWWINVDWQIGSGSDPGFR